MTARRFLVVLRLAVSLLTGLALLLSFGIWRLAQGPVSLDWLTPYLARALTEADSDYAVRIDRTLVELGQGGNLELLAQGVHVGRRGGGAELTLRELSLGLSLRAALGGVVAPTRIGLDGPELRLERAADGSFRLGLGGAEAPAEDWVKSWLQVFLGQPNHEGTLGYLTQLSIREASLVIDDRALGAEWRAKHAAATLNRSDDGSVGDLTLVLEAGGRETTFNGDFRYSAANSRFFIGLHFADLEPASFAAASPMLSGLAILQIPVSGQIGVELDAATWQLHEALSDLSFGRGTLRHPALDNGRLDIAAGGMRAAYDAAAGRITIDRMAIDLDGAKLATSGTIEGVGGGILLGNLPTMLDAALDLEAFDTPVDTVLLNWPLGVAVKPRAWITEHIHDGMVQELHARLGFHLDMPDGKVDMVQFREIGGTFAYRGVTVDYLPPVPAVRNVAGTANFDRTQLVFVPTKGATDGLQVTGGKIILSKLDTDDEQIAIDLPVSGELRGALKVITQLPLPSLAEAHLDPAHFDGRIAGEVTVKFPLKRDLPFKAVEYAVQAHLADVAITEVLRGRDLSGGDLQLRLDHSSLQIAGIGKIAEIPMQLTLLDSFKAGADSHRRYTIRAQLDEAARHRLGIDLPPGMLEGPVDVDVSFTTTGRQKARIDLSFDLRDAAIDIAPLSWKKAAGEPANATAQLDLAGDRVAAMPEATLSGAGIDGRFAASFSDTGSGIDALASVQLVRLKVGQTDVTGKLTRRPEGGWRIELRGRSLDAAGLKSELSRDKPGDDDGPPLVVDAMLDQVILGPMREALKVSAQLFSDGVHLQAASVDAELPGGKMALRFGQVAGDRLFHLSTDDFGGAARLFGISDNIAGGHLIVDGQAIDDGHHRVWRGHAEGADYRVIGAPVVARVLSVASLPTIGSLLNGEGIPFDRVKGDFTYDDGHLTLKEFRAYGGAIGFTMSGTFEKNSETIDVSGTVVPAYAVNSVLGRIPVLGKLLLGGEGQGIFGANYRVAGSIADPKVSVNPLSALAPGFLRNLFLFDAWDPNASAPAPAPAPSRPVGR